MRTAAITVHAAAAVAAFAAGAWLVLRARSGRPAAGFPVYFGALVTMAAALFVAVGLDWPRLGAATRAAFAALGLLAIVMVGQAERARRLVRATSARDRGAFIDRVGFTLIALFAGFVIITALDAGAPAWVSAVLAIAAVLAGRRVVAASRAASPRHESGHDEHPAAASRAGPPHRPHSRGGQAAGRQGPSAPDTADRQQRGG